MPAKSLPLSRVCTTLHNRESLALKFVYCHSTGEFVYQEGDPASLFFILGKMLFCMPGVWERNAALLKELSYAPRYSWPFLVLTLLQFVWGRAYAVFNRFR